jgi:ElaB/YqjD/DUF883 family membrane-anchored ribosome-binding protein
MATSETAYTKSLATMKSETRAAAGRTVIAAKKRLVELEKTAAAGLGRAAKATGTLAKQHPLVAAGVLVGTGVAVGVAAQRALHHKPTLGEVVMNTLSSSASRASKRADATAQRALERMTERARRVAR